MRYELYTLFVLFALLSINAKSQVLNKGVSGNNTMQLLQRIDTDVIHENPDLVIIMAGTNDLLNSKKMISYGDYAQNLKLIVTKIKEGGSQVMIMSPPSVDSVYLFMRHDRSLYQKAPNKIMDSVRHIVQTVAAENDALFLDLFEKFTALGIPKHNEDLFLRNQMNSGVSDGVHPTALGYHFIAEHVFQFLSKNRLINKDLKIICFGDSITKGAGVDKQKGYPAILAQLIEDANIE